MLKNITLNNVGPSAEMKVEFGDRLTVITGDNGLGKSFLLDVAWWALTRRWPAEVNPALTSGGKAIPSRLHQVRGNGHHDASNEGSGNLEGKISFSFVEKSRIEEYSSTYSAREQAWSMRSGRPSNPGLVLYAMTDGSFAVWDPARNYWRSNGDGSIQDRQPAYVFSPAQVWDGLPSADQRTTLCNGLIRDWASWQRENGVAFQRLKQVLEVLSPNPSERLSPGALTRISLDDARDMPTIKMPYGQDVPVVHASSGMRRILALAYFLTWAWEEHQTAASLLEESPTDQIILLVDEVEAHLHPQWQRRIVPALLSVMGTFSTQIQVQAIMTTHSPLVMASLEPIFSVDVDRWLDLDYVAGEHGASEVLLTERAFMKMGDASDWLTSQAFDLESARSLEAGTALAKAAAVMSDPNFGEENARALHAELAGVLPGTDPFWARWRYIAERKGWQL
jgi:hypothetical protein